MKKFIIEQSDSNIFTAHSGLALVGACVNRYTSLADTLWRTCGNSGRISDFDVLMSYTGLLCLGKSDFDAISGRRTDDFFAHALDLSTVPSSETMRQRMDNKAKTFREVVNKAAVELIKRANAKISALDTGHLPLDIDVFPMDNSDTKKEGVSWTYHNYDGYAPIAAYLGKEGWCMEIELRPGCQHSQKEFIPFLRRVIKKVRKLTKKKILTRLDSAHDALDTRVALSGDRSVSYIIKWNPRKVDLSYWHAKAFAEGKVSTPREGKRIAVFTIQERQEHEGKTYQFSRVMRVTERTIDKGGQLLLAPDVEVEGWWTNLSLPEDQIIKLYRDHATSEQFHSEFKTDLDLERLPSGKFATNNLVMALATLAYNILRLVGQIGMLGDESPVRHPAKRRRIRTVIQELIYLASRLIRTGRRLKLKFSRICDGFRAFSLVYDLIQT
jgi:hypothetical protein